MKSKSIRRKSVAVLAGIAIIGAVGASAASLGGLRGDELGADTGDVASCDTNGIDVAYNTSFDATAGEHVVDEIVLSDVHADCATQTVDLAVLRTDADSGTALSAVELSDTADGTGSLTITVTSTVVAEEVSGLAISISGKPVA